MIYLWWAAIAVWAVLGAVALVFLAADFIAGREYDWPEDDA